MQRKYEQISRNIFGSGCMLVGGVKVWHECRRRVLWLCSEICVAFLFCIDALDILAVCFMLSMRGGWALELR